MADLKISGLTELTTTADEDLLVTVDDPAGTPITKKITRSNFLNYGGTAEIADVAATEGAGTSIKVPHADHVHAHGAALHASGGTAILYYYKQYIFYPDAAPGTDVTAGETQCILVTGPVDETATRLVTMCETAPGTNVVVDLELGSTEDLDTVGWVGSGGATIKTVTHTAVKGVITTSFTTSALPAQRLMRLNIDSISGTAPRDLVVILETKVPLST